MANTINWAVIYCSSWWGDNTNQSTVDIDSKPPCL
jgi:hypothetical protein